MMDIGLKVLRMLLTDLQAVSEKDKITSYIFLFSDAIEIFVYIMEIVPNRTHESDGTFSTFHLFKCQSAPSASQG